MVTVDVCGQLPAAAWSIIVIDNLIIKFFGTPVEVVPYPGFTRGHPVLHARRELAYFKDLVQVIEVLDVAGVVPSKNFVFAHGL